MPKHTTQFPQQGLEPRLLDLETNALTGRFYSIKAGFREALSDNHLPENRTYARCKIP